MLSMRSWNRCVCTTQPRFTVAPSPQLDQVGLGQPVGLAPDAAADPCAHGAQPEVEHRRPRGRPARTTAPPRPRRRCRRARCARRTSSTAGARSRRSARPAPTCATVGHRRGHRARDQQHQPAEEGHGPPAVADGEPASSQGDGDRRTTSARGPTRGRAGTPRRGHRATRSRVGAGVGARRRRDSRRPRRSWAGGLPSQEVPAFALVRAAAPPTAPRRGPSWARAGRARSSPSCPRTRACRPSRARSRSQPPPSS